MTIYIVLAVALAVVFFAFSRLSQRKGHTQAQVRRMAHDAHSSSPSADLDTRVNLLLQQGQVIAAIRLIREETGWDLRKAKEYVDRLQTMQ